MCEILYYMEWNVKKNVLCTKELWVVCVAGWVYYQGVICSYLSSLHSIRVQHLSPGLLYLLGLNSELKFNDLPFIRSSNHQLLWLVIMRQSVLWQHFFSCNNTLSCSVKSSLISVSGRQRVANYQETIWSPPDEHEDGKQDTLLRSFLTVSALWWNMESWRLYYAGILDRLPNLSRWLWEYKTPSQLPAEITQSA